MRLRPVRGPRRAAAVASFLALCIGCLGACAADRASSNPTSTSGPMIGTGGTTVRVLQMNLCNSGRADCYSGGRAVSMAAALIDQERPDMVSLNEVCRDDVGVLEQAMSTTFPGAEVASAFESAQDRFDHAPVRCQNGQEFGDAVLAVVPSPPHGPHGFLSYSGVYTIQDPDDSEQRVWVCIDLASHFSACTTHTASTSTSTALAQCRYLLDSVVPTMSGRNPIILGADLNLAASGSPSPESCLPEGYQLADDDAVQHVVVSPSVGVGSKSIIDMRGTTDHPGLLVEIVLPNHRGQA